MAIPQSTARRLSLLQLVELGKRDVYNDRRCRDEPRIGDAAATL
jgi:hypothetical protein